MFKKIDGEKYNYLYDKGDNYIYFCIEYIGENKKIEKSISFRMDGDYHFIYDIYNLVTDDDYDYLDIKAKNIDFIIDKDNIFYKDFQNFLGEKEKIAISDDEPILESVQEGKDKRIEFSKDEGSNVLIRFTADNEFEIFQMDSKVMVKNTMPDMRSQIDMREYEQEKRGEKPDGLKSKLGTLFKYMMTPTFEKEYKRHQHEDLEEGTER
ncbi:MAG: hypothetical protein FWF46_06435 [Oscillospiraceae bacterium]|nr:hypothetical protein [Oscillospiraceae bacterium]